MGSATVCLVEKGYAAKDSTGFAWSESLCCTVIKLASGVHMAEVYMLGTQNYTSDRSIEVYKQTQQWFESSDLNVVLHDLSWVYFILGKMIPQTMESMCSGHFFPYTESWDELQISFTLCIFGLYKQSMVSLRSGLELGLLSVYWNLNDDGHKVIKDWVHSKQDTPKLGEIAKKLAAHGNFKLLDDAFDLKIQLSEFNYLHNYVHTKGRKYSNTLASKPVPGQHFDSKAIETWLQAFEGVIRILCILHLTKYPIGTVRYDFSRKFGIDIPAFGGLDKHEVDRLEHFIGTEIFQTIAHIGSIDPNVKEIMDWVQSLPDMTPEQLDQQSFRLENLLGTNGQQS